MPRLWSVLGKSSGCGITPKARRTLTSIGADGSWSTGAALDAIAEVVVREVTAGGAVTLPGLGKVACKARPERQVRNPATGETITKPADKQVKFAIAKSLKDSVNA